MARADGQSACCCQQVQPLPASGSCSTTRQPAQPAGVCHLEIAALTHSDIMAHASGHSGALGTGCVPRASALPRPALQLAGTEHWRPAVSFEQGAAPHRCGAAGCHTAVQGGLMVPAPGGGQCQCVKPLQQQQSPQRLRLSPALCSRTPGMDSGGASTNRGLRGVIHRLLAGALQASGAFSGALEAPQAVGCQDVPVVSVPPLPRVPCLRPGMQAWPERGVRVLRWWTSSGTRRSRSR